MDETKRSGPVPGPSIADIVEAYRRRSTSPADVLDNLLTTIEAQGDDGVWISVASRAALLARARELESLARSLPLWGVPFGVKDSVDIAAWETTLACPGYAYTATETAPVVAALLAAGAILVGKTNLDQFATGLSGTRTPYTIPRSVYGRELISGGSSSGSAVAVALAEVPFSVATDTAGSGRVPPALNGVAGFKPSRGLISTVGLVPACRSLDCVSLIAKSAQDLRVVFDVVAAPDDRDPWSRVRRPDSSPAVEARVGLPDFGELEFFGDQPMSDAHRAARELVRAAFPHVTTPPLQPFYDAGALLYQGPWVVERLIEFGDFLRTERAAILPVVAEIIGGAERFTALDVFRAQYRLAELKASVARLFSDMDVLVLPTVGTTFTVAEVLAAPIATNTMLGHYTHFANLLDLCALAVPAGVTTDGRPVSLMILGPALADDLILAVGAAVTELFDVLTPVPVAVPMVW